MTDWKEWFELWTLHTPDMRLKMVRDITFMERLYGNFKARMIAEQSWIMPRLEQRIKDNEAREKIRTEAESEK